MIKQREVAFMKTTGEAVFVLRFQDPNPKFGDKELQVWVRRPRAGQSGVEHIEEIYYIDELESPEEARAKFMAESQKIAEKYGPKAESLPSLDPNNGFSSN